MFHCGVVWAYLHCVPKKWCTTILSAAEM